MCIELFHVKSHNFAKDLHVSISNVIGFQSMHTPILVQYTCKIAATNFNILEIYAHFTTCGVIKNCQWTQFPSIFTLSYLKMYHTERNKISSVISTIYRLTVFDNTTCTLLLQLYHVKWYTMAIGLKAGSTALFTCHAMPITMVRITSQSVIQAINAKKHCLSHQLTAQLHIKNKKN